MLPKRGCQTLEVKGIGDIGYALRVKPHGIEGATRGRPEVIIQEFLVFNGGFVRTDPTHTIPPAGCGDCYTLNLLLDKGTTASSVTLGQDSAILMEVRGVLAHAGGIVTHVRVVRFEVHLTALRLLSERHNGVEVR